MMLTDRSILLACESAGPVGALSPPGLPQSPPPLLVPAGLNGSKRQHERTGAA